MDSAFILASGRSVFTPERCAKGWTRGMPPFRPPRAAPARRLPTVTAVASPERLESDVSRSDERAAALQRGADATRAVHSGERIKGGKKQQALLDSLTTPIVQSSTFTFKNMDDCVQYAEGNYPSYEYGRYGNPTTRAVEEKLMALEGAEDAILSSSGMNAVTTMLLALVPANGHVVTTTDCYRRTRQFCQTMLPKMGIRCTVLDPGDMTGLEDVLKQGGVSLYFSESPTNPLIRCIDTPTIVRLCRAHGAVTCIDTTFATPFNYKPIDDGADLVLHSGTKYLAGHNDVLCGALAGRADLVDTVRGLHGVLGGTLDPHAAFLVLRGMKTLGLRVQAHNRNAEALASFLDQHPKVAKVNYPTLTHHPDHALAKDLFNGFGGVLSFEVAGDRWEDSTFKDASRFLDALNFPYMGPSLGGVESIVESVLAISYWDQPLKTRQGYGISNGLIRFSCGIEDTSDLLADVEQALEAI